MTEQHKRSKKVNVNLGTEKQKRSKRVNSNLVLKQSVTHLFELGLINEEAFNDTMDFLNARMKAASLAARPSNIDEVTGLAIN